jgi:hypothetical protein
MMRKTLILLTGAAVALAGCHRGWRHREYAEGDHGPLRAVSALQCPDHEGSLTRVRVAPDGLSCDYTGPRGAEITLKLVKPADGDDTAALAALDSQVNALMPDVQAKVAEAPAQTAGSSEGSSSMASGDKVNIDLPFFHIHTRGEHASIRMPGVSVDADDDHAGGGSSRDGAAHVMVGGGAVEVRARNEAAVVRIRPRGDGVRAQYRLADEAPSADGWRLVGYDVRGPSDGPLVVAVVKSKETEEDPVFRDADRLVRANVGG